MNSTPTVAVVGLGYIGLPLAAAFGRRFPTVGVDADTERLAALAAGRDRNGDLSPADLEAARHLRFTADAAALADAEYVIVAVPTPIDAARRPDLGPLRRATETVAAQLRPGTTVIFESTVYPGCTEEECVPLLAAGSGLCWRPDAPGAGFTVAYSPERINPGDQVHRLQTVVKVVSGDSAQTLDRVARLYETIVEAGVHRAPSIRVAEAAKVIENTQRDLNIALMNELALIFERLGIDTLDVVEAAGTKWNFLPFRPGLVGGHCIGVDPYYLTHKAESVGYHPEVVLAGRRVNNFMGRFVAEQTVKRLAAAGRPITDSAVTVLGLAFKEDCPDLRDTRVIDIVRELESYGCRVAVHDPLASAAEAEAHYGVTLAALDALPPADALILAVPHRPFGSWRCRNCRSYSPPAVWSWT